MASTYSTRLRLEMPGTGDQSGSWGVTLNMTMGTLIEQAIAGHAAIVMSDANYTLTTVNGGSDEARNAALTVSGPLTAARDLIIPAVSKRYVLRNTTGQTVTAKVSGQAGAAVPAGATMPVFCDGTTTRPEVTALPALEVTGALTQNGGVLLPPGLIFPYAGSTTSAPAGYLFCAGQAVSRATYAGLFAVVSTTYGAGDGSTTFNVPDLRARFIAGADSMAGAAAGRLAGYTLGAVGGASTVTLAVANLPSHNHALTDPGHAHAVYDPGHVHGGVTDANGTHNHTYEHTGLTGGPVLAGSGSGYQLDQQTWGTSSDGNHQHSFTTYGAATGISLYGSGTGITLANTGSGTAFDILPPSLTLAYVIKT